MDFHRPALEPDGSGQKTVRVLERVELKRLQGRSPDCGNLGLYGLRDRCTSPSTHHPEHLSVSCRQRCHRRIHRRDDMSRLANEAVQSQSVKDFRSRGDGHDAEAALDQLLP